MADLAVVYKVVPIFLNLNPEDGTAILGGVDYVIYLPPGTDGVETDR